MDLVPTPGQVVSATGNLARLVRHGGLADLRPMERTAVEDGGLWSLHHYRPDQVVTPHGDPVVLVGPLAAPATCYDLRRDCSLVEHLVTDGRPTYLVDYAEISFRDRALSLDPWVREVVPAAVRAASGHAGDRPVHLVGWSLAGIIALLAAADADDLPVASLSVLGSPIDVSQVPLVAPLRPLLTGADVPIPVVGQLLGWAARQAVLGRVVAKPVAVATHLDDRDWLAQVAAVDRFTSATAAYPGRAFGRLYHRFADGNALAGGTATFGERTVTLADVSAPTLVVAGASDGIAPVASVRAALPLLTGSRETRFEIVPGGHLGLLTGRSARTTTWTTLDEWFEQWDDPAPRPRGSRDTIGTNRRRSSSAASRSLAR